MCPTSGRLPEVGFSRMPSCGAQIPHLIAKRARAHLPRLRRSVGSNLERPEAQSATQKTVAENVVVLSEAEDPLLSAPARKQVLRFAQDDNRLVSLRPRRLGGESAYDPALISVARSFSNVITNGFPAFA
jgi:hypothetical protein